jgi:hypothetical protein
MANEIALTRQLAVANGNLKDALAFEVITFTMGAKEKYSNIVTMTTSEADLTISGVTTPSLIYMRNLDASLVIQWGPKSGGSMVEVGRINANEEAWFRLGSSITLRARSVSGSPLLYYQVYG